MVAVVICLRIFLLPWSCVACVRRGSDPTGVRPLSGDLGVDGGPFSVVEGEGDTLEREEGGQAAVDGPARSPSTRGSSLNFISGRQGLGVSKCERPIAPA